MPPGVVQIVANGFSTDHPIPGLAFVNDSHIPVHDPDAVEAIGRGRGTGRHGRCDSGSPFYGPPDARQWWAGTTEPQGTALAWSVRYHPKYGRSVVLVRSADAWTLHSDWADDDGPLLFRAGGYWWDGHTWYRPGQVFDWADERYARRKVPGAHTITVADFLATADDPPAKAAVLTVTDVYRAARGASIVPMTVSNWPDHLRLWAGRRRSNALPLSQCVIDVGAPELAADQLIGTPELADRAGIAASTLRAYISRDEIEIPAPQAVVGGRKLWSRPVCDDWVESRSREPEAVAATMAGSPGLPIGKVGLRDRFAVRFFNRLWTPPFRKQWKLKSEDIARQRAEELGVVVADNLGDIIPLDALRKIMCMAVVGQFRTNVPSSPSRYTWVDRPTGMMLRWIVRHEPSLAGSLINDIIRTAKHELQQPREVSVAAIQRVLEDHRTSDDEFEVFLERVLPPAAD